MTPGHAPTELIADYAAGVLAPGMSLLMASHLTYCPGCRAKVARLEALGGALLAEGEAVEPAPRCLRGALARIEAPGAAAPARAEPGAPLPRPLCQRLEVPVCDLGWRPLRPGLSACRLDGFAAEQVGLMRAKPGVPILAGCGAGPEATLVLAGRMRDNARTYRCGELAFADRRAGHRQEAVGHETCLCLVVLPGDAGPLVPLPRA